MRFPARALRPPAGSSPGTSPAWSQGLGEVDVDALCNPEEEGNNHVPDFGLLGIVAAVLEVLVNGHSGVAAEAGVSDPADSGEGIGPELPVGYGGVPVEGDFHGDAAESDQGKLSGELAIETWTRRLIWLIETASLPPVMCVGDF